MLHKINHIISGCREGEARSQEALYHHCYAAFIKICFRYAGGDADIAGSLFNSAMLKVFAKIGSFRNEGEVMGWIRKIVVNCCIDHCRLKTSFNTIDLTEGIEYTKPVVPEIYNRLSGNEVVALLFQLPKNTGFVFNLFVLEGYKHEEIAALLGISVGTSKWHMNEARRLLKKKLQTLYPKELISNAS